jgi:hypothetical protein
LFEFEGTVTLGQIFQTVEEKIGETPSFYPSYWCAKDAKVEKQKH